MYSNAKKNKQASKYDRIHVIEQDQTKRPLRDLIAHPPEGSFKATITPEAAVDMLTFNTRNRPVSKSKVALYARQMVNGEWRYTGMPIIFSDQGRIIDGQHRLHACVESGAAFVADLKFGAPDDAFAFIDVGKPRSAGDIFAINGVQCSTAAAAVTRVVVGLMDEKHLNGVLSQGLTNAELYERYLALPGLYDSLHWYYKFQKARLGMPSIMAGVHYMCSQKNRRLADEFFEIACEGGAGKKTAPEQDLHRKLIQNAVSDEKMRGHYLAGLVITAWNRSRRGLSGRGMKFEGGKIPAVQ